MRKACFTLLLLLAVFRVWCQSPIFDTDAKPKQSEVPNSLLVLAIPLNIYMEQGLILEYNICNFGLYAGFGVNQYGASSAQPFKLDDRGFTVREGVLFFFGKDRHGYFSPQLFQRIWNVNVVGDGESAYYDDIIKFNLYSIVGKSEFVKLYSGQVRVNCFDLVFGYQTVKGHFAFEYYVGFGERAKYITISETASGNSSGKIYQQYNQPVNYQSWSYGSFDMKLGIKIGYAF